MAIFPGTMLDDVLSGTPEDDVLWGGLGNDSLRGLGGDDRLIGGPGADSLNGGSGVDTASYTQSPSAVHIDLSTRFADADARDPIRGGDADGDTLSSIENIWGSEFSDVIIGTHAPNGFYGRGGSDYISGMRGNDYLRGGTDDDELLGGAGSDQLFGDMGSDDLQGGDGDDILFGGKDDDTLSGQAGNDTLEGGRDADDLDGGDDSDTAAYTLSDAGVTINLATGAAGGGHAEGDTFASIENIRGSMHADMLVGDRGMFMENDPDTPDDESLTFVGSKNTIKGGAGNDTIKGDHPAADAEPNDPNGGDDTLHGGKGDDTLYGGGGNDTLYGEMGDDALKGEGGDDILSGGPGADKLFGGTVVDGDPVADEGMDTADYSKSAEGVRVDLGARTLGVVTPTAEGGDAEGDSFHSIENLTGSDHTDLLKGTGGPNVLKGGKGDDWNDPTTARVDEGGLYGRGGQDMLYGGAGNDWLDAGSGSGEDAAPAGGDTGTNNMLDGGAGDDMLIGGPGSEMVVMASDGGTPDNASDDTPRFEGGLYGGAGDDTLQGGGGGDVLNGGSGIDTADYSNSSVGVTIDLSDSSTPLPDAAGGDAIGDRLISIENITGHAGTATEGANNSLTGDPKANVLTGGSGGGAGAVVPNNLVTNSGDEDINNGATADLAGFDDLLDGAAGNDTLVGGSGSDRLVGGAGADTFVFGEQESGHFDLVVDFSKRQGDKIDLTALNLSDVEFNAILDGATEGVDGSSKVHVVLTLNDNMVGANVDGGRIAIIMNEAFTTLDADDFII